jgi:hypothetical protein
MELDGRVICCVTWKGLGRKRLQKEGRRKRYEDAVPLFYVRCGDHDNLSKIKSTLELLGRQLSCKSTDTYAVYLN